MPALSLVYGPHPIFTKTAEAVTSFDAPLHRLGQDMVETLYTAQAVGLGANMVGVLQRLIVVDLQDGGIRQPRIFINPQILEKSPETQCHEEASVCFPGIRAKIPRAREITLRYQDTTGGSHTLTATDYLATVIQHEMDYLDGVIFLDYLSAVKRKMLIKKTKKFQKMNGLS